MFKPQRLTFDELSERLSTYEQEYGYSTIAFTAAMKPVNWAMMMIS